MLIARDYSRKSGAKVLLFLHICKKKCEKVVKFRCFNVFLGNATIMIWSF